MPTLRKIPASQLAQALPAALDGSGAACLPVPNELAAQPHPCDGMNVPEGVALVIETSGSMSRPKRVMLSGAALLAGAQATTLALVNDEARALTGSARAGDAPAQQWVLALPEHYIAGAQVTVRALAAGSRPVRYPSGHFDATTFCDVAARLTAEHRFVSLVPVQLGRLLACTEPQMDAVMRSFTAILVGGQAVPAAMREAAQARGWRVVTTYGSSETAGGVAYNARPLPGVRVREIAGELQIASPTLAVGYLDDEPRTSDRFISDCGTRWYRTGDAGHVHPDGSIVVTGRLDNVIISGGVKINLDEIAHAASDAAGQQVIAVPVSDARWGQRVGLVIEAQDAECPGPLRGRVLAALTPFGAAGLPAIWVATEQLPRLASGKPDRIRCARLAQERYFAEL